MTSKKEKPAPNLNPIGRLKAKGLCATAAAVINLALKEIAAALDGVTKHPRWGDPIEEDFVQHIMVKGMFDPDTQEPWRLIVKERPQSDGTLQEELIDGARRLKHGIEAERRLRETAPRKAPLVFDRSDPSDLGHLTVQISAFKGNDVELLFARLAANNRPRAKPDSVHVLAITIAQLATAGCVNYDDIRARLPPGTTLKEVEALGRWDNLTAAAKTRYIESNAPLALLPAVLDVPDAEQVPLLDRFLAEGVRTVTGASRKLNAERKANSGAPRVWTPKKIAGFAKVFTATTPEDQAFLAGLLFRGDGEIDTLPPNVQRAIKAYDEKPRAAKQIR